MRSRGGFKSKGDDDSGDGGDRDLYEERPRYDIVSTRSPLVGHFKNLRL
jgi:hypothetical protein